MSWLSRLTTTFKPQLEKSQNYQTILNYAQQVSQLMGNGSREVPLPTFTFEVVTVDRYGKEINRVRRQASYFSENLGNDVTLDMVYVPGDTFMMGSPETEERIYKDEGPQHEVTIDSFFMSKYPVTQAQWEAVMGNNPSKFKGKNRPVERVSWKDAIEFCKRLSEITGKDFWLPSEAEQEYACRAGTITPFHFGETITSNLANYQGTSTYAEEPEGVYRKETTEVGSFPPNAFGLYNMHGNVWEWCADSWHANYENAPNDGKIWIKGANDSYRVLRGGSWDNYPGSSRAAARYKYDPDIRGYVIGFRVVART
jgi:formylglycine-generating enzyme required for sulfatase activity